VQVSKGICPPLSDPDQARGLGVRLPSFWRQMHGPPAGTDEVRKRVGQTSRCHGQMGDAKSAKAPCLVPKLTLPTHGVRSACDKPWRYDASDGQPGPFAGKTSDRQKPALTRRIG
jgi:hypothetical protein